MSSDIRNTRRKQSQFSFRCEDDEALAFEEIASKEGFKSVSAWVYHLAHQRAALMQQAIRSGAYLVIQGRHVPSSEIPNSDPMECRLYNGDEISTSELSSDKVARRLAEWLHEVTLRGTEEQRKRAEKLVGSHKKVRQYYNHLTKSAAPK